MRCVRRLYPPVISNRYTDENENTLTSDSTQVKDAVTSLVWQRVSVPGKKWRSDMLIAESAQLYCKRLNLGGQSWRLPTVKELRTLLDLSRPGSIIDESSFPDGAGRFWSSTPRVGSFTTHYAWFVDTNSGTVEAYDAGLTLNARCVR